MVDDGSIQEVKLFFEEIPAISDEEDDSGPEVVFSSDALPADAEPLQSTEGSGAEQEEEEEEDKPLQQGVAPGNGQEDSIYIDGHGVFGGDGDEPSRNDESEEENVFAFKRGKSGKKKGKKKKGKKGKGGPARLAEATVSFSAIKSTSKPAPRGGCTLTAVGSSLFLIGGANRSQQFFADVYTIDLQAKESKKGLAWKLLKTSGECPMARSGHSAVCHNSTIYIFGGMNVGEEKVFNDLFALDTETAEWRKLSPSGEAPCPRNEHAAELVGDKMVVFGGSSPEVEEVYNDVHVLSLADDSPVWSQASCSGPAPTPREMHSMFSSRHTSLSDLSCDNSTTVKLHVLGGRESGSGSVCSDLCTLSLDDFTWEAPVELPDFRRCSHTAGMVGENSVLVYGGWDGKMTIFNDARVLNLESRTWRDADLSKVLPPSRFGHAMQTSQDGSTAWVFGGVNAQCDLSDLTAVAVAVTEQAPKKGGQAAAAAVAESRQKQQAAGAKQGQRQQQQACSA